MGTLDEKKGAMLPNRVFARNVAISAIELSPQEINKVSGARISADGTDGTSTFTRSDYGPGGSWDEIDC